MTDMRATERLLEVIEQLAFDLEDGPELEIIEVARELRRRGDTLVRRDDLRKVSDYIRARDPISEGYFENGDAEHVQFVAAQDRLEIALGGRVR
jgi:hypothetical protein